MTAYVAAAETHTGAVLFVGDLAFKVKKPVDLGFVDFRRREDRRRACEREVELNRRLAPDAYLGVGELRLPDGEAEPAVVMRRLPADRRLSTLVRDGADVDAPLRQLAHRLAAFHLAAPSTPLAVEEAGATATWRRWEVNHSRLVQVAGRLVDPAAEARVIRLARRYLAGRSALFEARIADGRARDGHGDLLADDVFCLDDGPLALDCLDFDDRLRVGDVLADVAFLAMDLERLGRPDLGWQLLERHRDLTADDWPRSLAHHHVAYRAQVRSMVATIRADQGDPDAAGEAAALLAIAADHLERGRVRLVLVGGAPATGKSTLARGLGDALGAVVLRSDEVRKELAGLAPGEHAPGAVDEGLYTPAQTARTYEELLDRAARVLSLGESVVLDATWSDPAWRERARAVARATVADLDEVQTVLDPGSAVARAEARMAAGVDVSDAGPEVARALAERMAPWPEALAVPTGGPVEATLHHALERLQGRQP